jgi:hypothetical protein
VKLPLLLLLICPLVGCSTTNISKLVRELAKDPATVAISVQSVYGTMYFMRTVATNQQIIMGPIQVKP